MPPTTEQAAAAAAATGLAVGVDTPADLDLQQQQLLQPAASGGVGAVTPRAVNGGGRSAVGNDQGVVLLAVLLCTLLRGSKLQESKVSKCWCCAVARFAAGIALYACLLWCTVLCGCELAEQGKLMLVL
jgi:hypothetical protein